MKNKNKLLDEFKQEITTCWSFPERGKWATHNPKYRGNFAPQIARNIILQYSEKNDLVLDPMVGSGTTLIECKLLERNAIGIDINPTAVELTTNALDFDFETQTKQKVSRGNILELSDITDNSIDLICTHPPYLNIVKYSNGELEKDLSNISSPNKFITIFDKAIQEMYRVLKDNHYCAILIGDTRKGQHYVPLAYMLMNRFLRNGFILKEEIIKSQHNCVFSKRWESKAKDYKFYLIMHEHLFVFRKPSPNEDLSKFRWSRIPPGQQTIIE